MLLLTSLTSVLRLNLCPPSSAAAGHAQVLHRLRDQRPDRKRPDGEGDDHSALRQDHLAAGNISGSVLTLRSSRLVSSRQLRMFPIDPLLDVAVLLRGQCGRCSPRVFDLNFSPRLFLFAFQRAAFSHFPELQDFALSNVAAVDTRDSLTKHFGHLR